MYCTKPDDSQAIMPAAQGRFSDTVDRQFSYLQGFKDTRNVVFPQYQVVAIFSPPVI